MSFYAKDSPLGKAKEVITILAAARRLGIGLGPETQSSFCSPFRDDSRPSFSVFDEGIRYFDHGTGEGGDVVDFSVEERRIPALMRIRRAAKEADISVSTVRRAIKSGELRAARTGKRAIVIRRECLIEWIKSKEEGGAE